MTKNTQTTIIWTGKLYHSIEHCVLTEAFAGNEIASTIIGDYEGQICKVDYQIKTNSNWETTFASIKMVIDNSKESETLAKINGHWLLNDKLNEQLNAIYDIDISLTPFTN